MSEVQRWNLKPDEQYGPCSLWTIESENGEFVLYEDYAELKAQRDALAAEREKFAVHCAAAKIAVQYAQKAGFDCTLNTPAVDDYANQLRAEGVEMFASQKMGEAEKYDSNLSREIAIAAKVFAANLRKENGND